MRKTKGKTIETWSLRNYRHTYRPKEKEYKKR